MQLDILIVGVLFPAIPLMMINFGNRYSLLAGLIRSLHDTVINAQTPADDSARFFQQIASLRQSLRLLAVTQTFSAVAFIFNLSAMISLYLSTGDAGSWLFFSAITLMIVSMVLFTLKFRSPTRRLMCIYPVWKNIRNGKIIRKAKNADANLLLKNPMWKSPPIPGSPLFHR